MPDVAQEAMEVSSRIMGNSLYKSVEHAIVIFMPPFEEGGAYCVAHVGQSVCLYPLALCN